MGGEEVGNRGGEEVRRDRNRRVAETEEGCSDGEGLLRGREGLLRQRRDSRRQKEKGC